MVGLIREMTPIKPSEKSLNEIVRQEVARYAGYSPLAKLYPILDDSHQIYAVVIIEDDPAVRPAYVVVMARVMGDYIVIDEDRSFDKPLVDALIHNGGIPREQIILAYAGEKLPEQTEVSP